MPLHDFEFDCDHPEYLEWFDPDGKLESTVIQLEVHTYEEEDHLEVEQIFWNGKEIDPPQQAWEDIAEQLEEKLISDYEDAKGEKAYEDYLDRMSDPGYY